MLEPVREGLRIAVVGAGVSGLSTFFAGAPMRYGFHEDGLISGMRVAEALGCTFDTPTSRREEHAA